MKPAQFELSADTRFIRQRLHELRPGDSVPYTELSALINKTVEGATPALQSAKRSLLKEGYVFAPIFGEGIKRLADDEVVTAADGDIATMRRRARKAGMKLSTVSYEQLTPTKQLALTAKVSIVGAIAAIATGRAIVAIEKVASGKSGELPIAETMRALGYSK